MHAAALRELGLPWSYAALPVAPALFAETVRALPGSGYRGANVTIPHKARALALADGASPAATAIGAANTLSFSPRGGILAENTDAGGFLDALERPASGLRCLVLGAGGAARAVAWALREDGAAEVVIWNRTPERASALASALELAWVERPAGALARADLVVNTTAVGLGRASSEREALAQLGLEDLEPPELVADLVYATEPTPVAAWGERGGARVVDGLEVLVRQGARSLELWSARRPPVDAMRVAARDGWTSP